MFGRKFHLFRLLWFEARIDTGYRCLGSAMQDIPYGEET